jgi:DNA polymerase (family 10)
LGIPITISTDAHSPEGLDVLGCGINQARRAGLTAADVANTWTAETLLQRLSGR